MTTLIIYDNSGKVFSNITGNYILPSGGVQFLEVDIPKGKQLKIEGGIGVDVSVTPHQAILEDIPPTEIDKLRLEIAQSNTELFEMMMAINMNGGLS